MKTLAITKQPDGSWKEEITDSPYPDPGYEAVVQAMANANPGMVACGAQKFEEGKDAVSCPPIVIRIAR